MKYVQPYGISDADAPYINGDPSIARQGSIPPAAAFEHPMREIVGVIQKNGLPPDSADLLQLVKGTRSQKVNFAEDTGSVNTLSVAFDPPITSYSLGLPIRVRCKNNNSGPATIDAGAGRVQIRKPTGAQVASGDLTAGGLIELVYDGAAFQMINFGGAGGGTGSTFYYNIPYTVDASTTPNLIIANFSPPVTALSAGTILMVKANTTNTGPTQINVQGLGAKFVYALGGGDLLPSDIINGDVLILTYDGTRFWINPNPIINQNVTFNCANNGDIVALFNSIARKRIQPDKTVTIKLAQAIFGPFKTFHIDSDRIIVAGTMKAARPTVSDFAKTGSSAGARAADSANNIAMLRSRYGTEIRFQNTDFDGCVQHNSSGRITFQDLLIAGPNVSAGADYVKICAIRPPRGGSIYCVGVSVWGSGSMGFMCVESVLDASYCFSCSNYADGFFAFVGGNMVLDNCGSFGNNFSGMEASQNSQIYAASTTQSSMNALYGITSSGTAMIGLTQGCTALGNGVVDAGAYDISECAAYSGAIGSSSPAPNTVGNNGALVKLI